MKKRVLVICTGPRRGGNSETLADALIKGAHEAGHDVDKICLYDKTINFCTGCLACQKSQRCVIHDDADLIASQMQKAEVIVFATPIYLAIMLSAIFIYWQQQLIPNPQL